ncbi:MAG: peptide chain release factor 1 [Clostridia bacterium]|nr:peptide chain release factor 1 [Clostridia bacterium]
MTEKLDQIVEKLNKIDAELLDPAVVSDPAKYRELMKERKNILPVVEKYMEYKSHLQSRAEAEEILSSGDSELYELAKAELDEAEENIKKSYEELKILLLPRDPNDDKNVVIEIRGGAGGDEAALFSYVLYRMYCMYADSMKWKTELMYCNETELGGFKEVSFTITGDGAYSRLKFESGVHRVQRVPETEAQGRIHTSTVTVAVLPEADDVEVEINPADIKFETCKSSGAGGQHINKTESAIRLYHKPTGIIIECQDERSQFKNKDKALKLLKTKLYDMKRREQHDKIANERKSQVGTGDRSERIRTYNYPQSRVTDHRINMTVYSLESFLNGDMNAMIDALITADTAAKLSMETEN